MNSKELGIPPCITHFLAKKWIDSTLLVRTMFLVTWCVLIIALTSVLSTPRFSRIFHIFCLGALSKPSCKSNNSTKGVSLYMRTFAFICPMVKIESIVSLLYVNPSWLLFKVCLVMFFNFSSKLIYCLLGTISMDVVVRLTKFLVSVFYVMTRLLKYSSLLVFSFDFLCSLLPFSPMYFSNASLILSISAAFPFL